MTIWQAKRVPIKFQLSDWTLFSVSILLSVRAVKLVDQVPPATALCPPSESLPPHSQGFLIRGLPIAAELPATAFVEGYLCYSPLQYDHCYIDLSQTFDAYQQKFSSKTRSTINRKIKKFVAHCGGTLSWKTYKTPEEMRDFFQLARAVSKLTYQERLLDAGIPDSEAFIHEAELLAATENVRAYLLFHGERPVSYLYCPVEDGVLIYAYLGYDPEYMHMSVGTVLQWLAIEQIFAEGRFRYFDFTEGQSEHKRLFATHQQRCANVFILKNTLRTAAIVYGHRLMDRVSTLLGTTLDKWGVKAKARYLLRRFAN